MVKNLVQLVIADFSERTRRYSFLLTMLGMFFASYLIFTGKYTMQFGQYVGELNSPWVGSFVALYCSIIIVFAGFFIVKNTISLDQKTGVGQIIAASPVSNTVYIIGKFISNFLILFIMLLFMVVSAIIMQVTGETSQAFDLLALLLPFVYITLPVVVFVAALAVFFESVKWLSGLTGNIIYFIVMEFLLMFSVMFENGSIDLGHFYFVTEQMREAALAYAKVDSLGFSMGFIGEVQGATTQEMQYFTWAGIPWSFGLLLPRLLWVGVGLLLVVGAIIFFKRFDPSTVRAKAGKIPGVKAARNYESSSTPLKSTLTVNAMEQVKLSFNYFRLVFSEFSLSLKSQHWVWLLVALIFLVLQIFIPFEFVKSYLLPVAWVWPVAVWSAAGTRDRSYNTLQILSSCPSPLRRQMAAAWMSGILVALVTGAGAMLRSLYTGQLDYFLILCLGAVFIPTLAMLLGAVSGSKKLFELIYLGIWYVGPLNGLQAIDFLGTTSTEINTVFLIGTLLLIPAIWVAGALSRSRL